VAELCAATSMFTDLGTGQPQEHGLRTCLVAMRLAEALGVDSDVGRATYYATLLRFLGCTADAHLAAEAGGDEIRLFAAAAPVTMGSPRVEMARILRLVGGGKPVPERLRLLAGMLADPRSKERLLDAHCEVAARLARRVGMEAGVVEALEAAYARWDGKGVPGLAGHEIPLPMRIAVVARDVELWAREAGGGAAAEMLVKRRGRAYDPEVVDAALEAGPDQLREAPDEELWEWVLALEPEPWVTAVGPEIETALEALGDFAEVKAPEFAGSWRRVRELVGRAGAGVSPEEGRILRRAATVYDVGSVGVPVLVWRSARPGSAAWETVRLHPLWTCRVLERCEQLHPVAITASRHHERQDGSGYPGAARGDLDRVEGLLAAAVVYDELTTGGPGVEKVASDEAVREMNGLASTGLLPAAGVGAVLAAAGHAREVEISPPAGLTEREVDVLRLLASGMTNRQIAAALGISAKTVGTHVEHIYGKAGVRTRAGATLFAIEEKLVGG
jgi:response regulator RpfG family c-di-GMP phosphodiesterase/DNA-binding CsgD family transcriptional regulator